MKKANTPSFIVELPIKTLPFDIKELSVRFDVGRALFNACLDEALDRLSLMRQSKEYRQALRIPKTHTEERKSAFASVRARYGLKDSAIQSFAVKCKNSSHIGEHLDTHTTQKTGTRAFDAVMKHLVGKRGRPRFKSEGRFRCLESKTNKNGIRYRDGFVVWKGLELECRIDPKDEVIAHGLSCPIKYCRIVMRKYKGRNLFYVQLVVEGRPFQKEKNRCGSETVGIDIGPSTIAYVGETKAVLTQFCEELAPREKEIRLLQRKLDRQRRGGNPDNYNPDGTIKRGKLKWNYSHRYIESRAQLSELHRVHAAQRKTLQGKLSNELLRVGKYLRIEKNSYKAFQALYGKSIGMRAPSLFVSSLIRKAVNAGGYGMDIPAGKARLSQACLCGRIEKKPLSQRWHICDCGVVAQRDLFSAYLARHTDSNGVLDTSRAKDLWNEVEPLLRQAVSRIMESASGKALPSSFGLNRRQSGLSVNSCAAVGTAERAAIDVGDGVAGGGHTAPGESPEEVAVSTGTPAL